jgi:hypothetical protein
VPASHNSDDETALLSDVGGRLANVFHGNDVSGHSSIEGVPITLFNCFFLFVFQIQIELNEMFNLSLTRRFLIVDPLQIGR